MNPAAIAADLADHSARLDAQEKRLDATDASVLRTDQKIDKLHALLTYAVVGVLIAVLTGLGNVVVTVAMKKGGV